MQNMRSNQDNGKTEREQQQDNKVLDLTGIATVERLPANLSSTPFICEFCNCPLIQKKDDIDYLGALNVRWICPSCGKIKDQDNYHPEIPSGLKHAEEPRPVVGFSPQTSTITPIAEIAKNSEAMNTTRGTRLIRDNASKIHEKDPEPLEEEYLRGQGYILKQTTLELPGSGIRVTKVYQ